MYKSNKVSQQLKQYYLLFFAVLVIYFIFYMPNTSLDAIKILVQNNMAGLSAQTDIVMIEAESNLTEISDSTSQPEPPQLFFVNNSLCKIPYVNAFTPETLEIYKPPDYEACSNESDLVTPIFDINLKRYVLHINDTVAMLLMNSSTNEYNCCYEEIIHSKKGDSYEKPLPRIYFSQGYVVPTHVEGIMLECHLVANTSHKLQRDAFFFVQQKHPGFVSQVPRNSFKASESKDLLRKPSVIMFGIDALSRINFRRTMPEVYEHMKRRGWYELQGYNKVGDNTLPNLLAILSGYDSTKNICNAKKIGCLDDFPIIWKDFKNAGYLTAYAEDETFMSTFNLLKPGFQKQPTDFYFRPFMKTIEDKMDVVRKGLRYCIGRRVVSSYIYDFCRHFMQRFVDERPIFGLFWTNHFSHDDWKMPALMSDKILQYLLDFEADGAMDKTIMIFLADHGARYGKILNLPEGFLEERLPTMFIWLPQWFRDQYPEYAEALQVNRNRLTSNYDLYMTLKHIIQLGTPYDLKMLPANDCPKCQSIFYPMPEERTCSDAGISDHWCTCNPYTVVTQHKYAREIPYLVADRINAYILTKNLKKQCKKLTPRYLDLIELKLNLDKAGNHIVQEVDTYRTKFTVNPKGAEFQATVVFNNRTKALDVDVETISRLTSYHNDSLCINDKEAKKFCICRDSIKTTD